MHPLSHPLGIRAMDSDKRKDGKHPSHPCFKNATLDFLGEGETVGMTACQKLPGTLGIFPFYSALTEAKGAPRSLISYLATVTDDTVAMCFYYFYFY